MTKHEAFDRYSENCELAGELGAFHDCPVGTNPGSLESKSASYTSNQTHRELLECVADAVREYWLRLRKSSPRWSVCCDETSDVSGKSQNAVAAKIVLPDGKTAVPFIGLHEMPRGTSGHLKNTLVYQVLHPSHTTYINISLPPSTYVCTCLPSPTYLYQHSVTCRCAVHTHTHMLAHTHMLTHACPLALHLVSGP